MAKGAGVGKAGSGAGKKIKSSLQTPTKISASVGSKKTSVKTARGTRTNIRRIDAN